MMHPSRVRMMSIAGGLRILLIDDHPGSLLVLRHVLRSHGHVCEGAQTADAALALVPALLPHVIIYEWHLRGGRGVGLAHRLRTECAGLRRQVAIVALSTLNEPDGFVEREGVDGYVNKPFCPDALDRLLASVGASVSRAGGSA